MPHLSNVSVIICLVILQIKQCVVVDTSHQSLKCCDYGYVVEKIRSKYTCQPDTDKRIFVLDKNTIYLNKVKNIDIGSCVDIINNTESNNYYIAEFKVKSGRITQEGSALNLDYFYKCCPVGYLYNKQSHSCVENSQDQLKVIGNFVRIGLPKCNIIEDVYVNSEDEFEYQRNNALLVKTINQVIEYGNYCVDKVQNEGGIVIRICRNNYDVCKKVTCLRKCCPDGQGFLNSVKYCRDTHDKGINISSFQQNVNISSQGNNIR